MLNRLLPVLIVNLLAVSGYAADVCKTLPECQQLKTQLSASLAAVDARIQALQPSPQIGDIARNTDGSIRYMDQADAINYCACDSDHARKDLGCTTAPNSNHLPSARELAQLASQHCTSDLLGKEPCGAAGISETAEDGYKQVSAKNADGKNDSFYFNYSGYQQPAGDLGNNWFWSSSVNSIDSDGAFDLYGGYGFVGNVSRRKFSDAVRCARGQ